MFRSSQATHVVFSFQATLLPLSAFIRVERLRNLPTIVRMG